jgi:ketosteroid isomerase-like protein
MMGETDTVVNRERGPTPVTSVNPAVPTSHVPVHQERRRSKTGVALAVVFVTLLLLVALGGFGAFMFMRNRPVASNVNATNQNNNVAKPSPTPTPKPKPSPLPSAAAEPGKNTVKNDQVAADLETQIDDWASALENGDLEALMQNYAATVDYFNKRGATASAIRADKSRALALYDGISVNVSNVEIRTNDDATSATATFDKEWDFEGKNPSEGKTRSQLDFRYVNGQWKIVAERDLKVYYKR